MKLLTTKIATMILLIATMLTLSGCGGGGGTTADPTVEQVAISTISDYAANGGKAPDESVYTTAGVVGVDSNNVDKLNEAIKGLSTDKVDSTLEIQGIFDSLDLDTVAPVITIKGDNPITVIEGRRYTDAGASANDAVDGIVPTVRGGMININVKGTYTIIYTAKDSAGNIAEANRTAYVVANKRPVANAGKDISVFFGDKPDLNGTASYDANGDKLAYNWSIIVSPLYSEAVLTNPTSATPSLKPDLKGNYMVRLEVGDGYLSSTSDIVNITVKNHIPIAVAGDDKVVTSGDSVDLNGSASHDIDGDSLDYNWTLSAPSGSSATLSNTQIPNPIFEADKPGVYTLRLIVNDGTDDSVADTVTVKAKNRIPYADAGTDKTTINKVSVDLNASYSDDDDGDPLTYKWTVVSKPTGSTLTTMSGKCPTFTPDKKGTYVVSLVVNDGMDNSTNDANITITATNNTPVANAGTDENVSADTNVTLNGTGSSDIDGDSLDYNWSIVSKPSNSSSANIIHETNSTATLIPDVKGTYTIRLKVSDGTASSQDDVTIMVANATPVANAGADAIAYVNSTVHLDGSDSNDSDGDSLDYNWTITADANGSTILNDANTTSPYFDANTTGDYTISLVVYDGTIHSTASTVTITVKNNPPVAKAGEDNTTLNKVPVDLNGSGSYDVDGDPIQSYTWTVASKPLGSTTTISNGENTTFTPDKKGTYIISLVVNDGNTDSIEDNVTIIALNNIPVAIAGSDQNVSAHTIVDLNGTASTDIDDDNLTYAWSILSSPANSDVTTSNAVEQDNQTFTPDIKGVYVLGLVASDDENHSINDANTTIRVANAVPVAMASANHLSVYYGETVDLNGSASNDDDKDPLTYSWTLLTPAGSSSTLSDNNISNPTFMPDKEGNYTVQLIVNDGEADSNESNLTVEAKDFDYVVTYSGDYNDFNGSAIWDMELSKDGSTLYAAVKKDDETVNTGAQEGSTEEGLTILNLDTNATEHIDTGLAGDSVKLSSDGNTAYITSGDDDNLSIIDLSSSPKSVTGSIHIADYVHGIAVSENNTTLYLGAYTDGFATVALSGGSATLTNTTLLEENRTNPVALSSDESKLYIGENKNGLHIYNFHDSNYTTILTKNTDGTNNGKIVDFAISANEKRAYIAMGNAASAGANGVDIVSLVDKNVTVVITNGGDFSWTTQVKVTSDEKLVFVAARHGDNHKLFMINTNNSNSVSSMSAGSCTSPRSVEISPNGKKLYLGCSHGTISAFDLKKIPK